MIVHIETVSLETVLYRVIRCENPLIGMKFGLSLFGILVFTRKQFSWKLYEVQKEYTEA